MNAIAKVKLGIAASRIIDAAGKLQLPQGPLVTQVGSLALTGVQWINASGNLVPESWWPYTTFAIALLQGIYSLSALAKPANGTWAISDIGAFVRQFGLVVAQTGNAFLPIATPEQQAWVSSALSLLQNNTAISAVHQERK